MRARKLSSAVLFIALAACPRLASASPCVAIVSATLDSLEERLKTELTLAGEEVQVVTGMPPNLEPREVLERAKASRCERVVHLSEESVTVWEGALEPSPRPVDRLSRPLTEAAILQVVETIHARGGLPGGHPAAQTAVAPVVSPARVSSEPATAAELPPETPGKPSRNRVRHHVLDANPLALGYARLSLDYEIFPAVHHSISLGAHAQFLYALLGSSATDTFTGYGGELGYRFYSGSRGPDGFFVGASFSAGRYHGAESLTLGSFGTVTNETSFSSYAGAADLGWSFLVGTRMRIAIGGGCQYTRASEDNIHGSIARLIGETGVRPRILFALGWTLD